MDTFALSGIDASLKKISKTLEELLEIKKKELKIQQTQKKETQNEQHL